MSSALTLPPLWVDGLERLAPYLALAAEPESVVALARQRLDEATVAIVEATGSVDAFDVLEAFKRQISPQDPETFRESDHGATVAMIELAALILASRGGRAGVVPSGGGEAIPGEVLPVLQVRVQELMDAGQMLNTFCADRDEPLHRISFGARLREVAVRNSSYPHMVEDTLTALFNVDTVETECRTVLGCTVDEIRTVLSAFAQLAAQGWNSGLDALAELDDLLEVVDGQVDNLTAAEIEQARELLGRAVARPGTHAVHTAEEIATETGLNLGTVTVVLTLFSTPMRARQPVEVVREFFEGMSPLRTRPLLSTSDGEYIAVHHALLIPAIRERVEELLRTTNAAWNTYSKHRGAYLEGEATRLVARHLPGCVQHLGFEYFVPTNDRQTTPAAYAKLVEGDALLLIDDVAVIIEAKAVALRPRSRAGDPLRLRQDLRRIVTDAADQADRSVNGFSPTEDFVSATTHG